MLLPLADEYLSSLINVYMPKKHDYEDRDYQNECLVCGYRIANWEKVCDLCASLSFYEDRPPTLGDISRAIRFVRDE